MRGLDIDLLMSYLNQFDAKRGKFCRNIAIILKGTSRSVYNANDSLKHNSSYRSHLHSVCHRAIRYRPPTLHIVTVNARRRLDGQISQVRTALALIIYIFEVESVDMAWKVSVRRVPY